MDFSDELARYYSFPAQHDPTSEDFTTPRDAPLPMPLARQYLADAATGLAYIHRPTPLLPPSFDKVLLAAKMSCIGT
jgi:hypothetical protein